MYKTTVRCSDQMTLLINKPATITTTTTFIKDSSSRRKDLYFDMKHQFCF